MPSGFAERRAAVFAVVLAAFASACGDKTPPPRTTPTADASAGAESESGAAVVDGTDGATPGSPLAWPDAIRAARWTEAAEGLARLPEGEQNKPEVRLARGRVALATGKAADAVHVLERLDEELPLVRDLVARTRAQAMLEVGPFDKAADYFASRRDAASLILAAELWEKTGDSAKARILWERAIVGERRSRAQEEKARHHRLKITRLKDGDIAAGVDARWLATNALDPAAFSEAAELLEKLSPPRLLTAEELLTRAKILAEAGRTEEALRAIERATTRKNLPTAEVCRARAEAYWKARTRYAEAALAYRACAGIGSAHAQEDLFLSARAFARAERDGDAIPAFQSVIAKHPRTTWADQSEFYLARNHALAGRWKEAAFAFDEYVQHWPTGKEKREARRYQALAHLLIHDDKRARKLLEDLSGGSEDPVTAARWTNLAALAALRDGDKLHALARWAEVARSRPLSYPALIARARLLENGGTVPPAIEPAETATNDLGPIELPQPADMLHRIGFDAEAEDALREREAAVVIKAEARRTETLCVAYGSLAGAKRRYQLALQIPVQTIATAPSPKSRFAWECLFPRPYDGIVRPATTRTRIAPELVYAVMRQESAFDPDVVSPARAVGLMQILPETARATATNAAVPHEDGQLTSPAQSILLGSLYLRELLDKFGDNPTFAIAGYNAGPEAVQRWLSHAKTESLDVFVETIRFIETRGYVARVLGNLARYGYLDRGDAGVPAIALPLKRE